MSDKGIEPSAPTKGPSWDCETCHREVHEHRGPEHAEDCMTAAAEENASDALRLGGQVRRLTRENERLRGLLPTITYDIDEAARMAASGDYPNGILYLPPEAG